MTKQQSGVSASSTTSGKVSFHLPEENKDYHQHQHDHDNNNTVNEKSPLIVKTHPSEFLTTATDTTDGARYHDNEDYLDPTEKQQYTLESQMSGLSASFDSHATSGSHSNSSSNGTTSQGSGKGWKTLRKLLEQGDLALKLKEQANKKMRTRSSIRRQKFDEFHSGISFTVQQCLISILAYIITSILVFSFLLEPNWTIVDSSYFAVTTFTTLGYGDLTPTSTISRFFTCAYALLGVIALGLALGNLGNQMIEKHQRATHRAEEMSRIQIMSFFAPKESKHSVQRLAAETTNHLQADAAAAAAAAGCDDSISDSFPTRANIFEKHVVNFSRLFVLVTVMLLLAFWIGNESGWDIPNTIYYLIITGSTIGYGDLAPDTQVGRFLAVFFIPLACGVTGHVLGYIANQMVDNKAQQFLSQYKAKELTQEDIDAMDTDNDGKVTWSEFLEFMLIAMDKIDYELLDELQLYFQHLDVSGTGELSRADLAEMARRKLKSPRRKLELANYKRHLLEQADKERQQRQNILRMSWIPQLFRRHDLIRQPWRSHATDTNTANDNEHDDEQLNDQSSMREACNAVATMVDDYDMEDDPET